MRTLSEIERKKAVQLTDEVLARYASTPDPRLREILLALIHHLHAFVREVRLTESEWMKGIEFLTKTGQLCDEKRNEMILLSDNLGLSALVNLVSAGVEAGATETTVIGPFYNPKAPKREWGQSVLIREGADIPLMVHGRVLGLSGESVPHAKIEIWQTDTNGNYDMEDLSQPEHNLRGWYEANDKGEFLIRTIKPTSYPIPTDGTVGGLLRATNRHPWRPAHIHAIISAPGYQTLTTHLFDSEDKYLESDVVFAVKKSLIRRFQKNERVKDAEKFGIRAPFWELQNDFVLRRAEAGKP